MFIRRFCGWRSGGALFNTTNHYRQIRALEERLQGKLFKRKGRVSNPASWESWSIAMPIKCSPKPGNAGYRELSQRIQFIV